MLGCVLVSGHNQAANLKISVLKAVLLQNSFIENENPQLISPIYCCDMFILHGATIQRAFLHIHFAVGRARVVVIRKHHAKLQSTAFSHKC